MINQFDENLLKMVKCPQCDGKGNVKFEFGTASLFKQCFLCRGAKKIIKCLADKYLNEKKEV